MKYPLFTSLLITLVISPYVTNAQSIATTTPSSAQTAQTPTTSQPQQKTLTPPFQNQPKTPVVDPDTLLITSVKKNDIDQVKAALSKNAHPSAKDSDGNTPLNNALQGTDGKSFFGIIPLLIAAGADANTPDKDGTYPVLKAPSLHDPKKLFTLLLAQKNLNPNLQDSNGNTPLMLLINRMNQEEKVPLLENLAGAAALLLETDGITLDTTNNDGQTALHYAVVGTAWDWNNLGEKLLAKHPNVNIQDKNGDSPLIKAVKSNNIGAVPALLKESSINLDAQDKGGKTALALAQASESGQKKTCSNVIVQLLLNAGATSPDLAAQLFAAAQAKDSKKTVEQLINQGVSVNSKDNAGNTPLMLAAQAANDETVSYLLSVQDQYHVQQAPKIFDPSRLQSQFCFSVNVLPFTELDAVDTTIKNTSGNDALSLASNPSTKKLIQNYNENLT
jgi:ankyrin repeat protein